MRSLQRVSATLAVCGFLAAGCSGSAGQSGGEGTPDANSKVELVETTKPAKGGIDQLDWSLFEEPTSLDPDRATGDDADAIIGNICEGLFRIEPDLSVEPRLAEDVERVDPRTFVMKVRDDVRFHTGRELTAEDVVWSLRRHARPESGESDEFAGVASIDQTGDMEVTIKLTAADPQLEYRLAGGAGIILDRMAVSEQGKDYGTAGSADACTGPFELDSWNAGSHIVLTRFEDYWDTDGKALPAKVRFVWGNEAAVANNLRTGTVDGAYLSEPTLVPTLRTNDGLSIYYGASTGAEKLIPTDRGNATDPRIRRALSLAIDRAGIVEAGFQGVGEPWKAPVGPGAWGYAKDTFEQAYADIEGAPAAPSKEDLDEAKALVEEAGVPDQPIVIGSNGTQLRNVIANALRSAGEKIGVPVEIKTYSDAEYGELFSSAEARSEVDFVSDDWYLSKPEPLGLFDNLLPDESSNYLGYQNDEYVTLYKKAAQVYDDEKRAELVVDLQELAMADMLWIPLAAAPNTLVLNDELTGAPVSFAFRTYPWAADIGRAG